MVLLTIALVAFLFALFIFKYWISRPDNFPPGPTPFPLVGCIPALAGIKEPTKQDIAWALCKQYGPVTGIFLGPWPVVVISGYEASKNVLSRDDIAYRPKIRPVNSYQYEKRLGIFFTDGLQWRDQRRFLLRQLRDFGYARRGMEPVVHEEARVMLDAVEDLCYSDQSEGVDLMNILPRTAVNILWTVMAGQRYDFHDKKFKRIVDETIQFFRNSNPLSIVALYPLLQIFPIGNSMFKRQILAIKDIQDYIQEVVDDHLETYDENHTRDFIDVFIKEMKAEPNSLFTREQLISVCSDMLAAAAETLSSTLAYALRYLIQHPQIQTKLRNEIHDIVGTERLPTMEDISNLHYATAIVNETLRHSGAVPFTAPHAVDKDTELMGYFIPKDCLFLINLWSIHMDPEIWGDPEVFRPERFINKDGVYQKDARLIPFGFGPRVCAGETVSRQTFTLLLTTLVQRFKFAVPSKGPPPDNGQLPGVVTAPTPFKVAVSRCG